MLQKGLQKFYNKCEKDFDLSNVKKNYGDELNMIWKQGFLKGIEKSLEYIKKEERNSIDKHVLAFLREWNLDSEDIWAEEFKDFKRETKEYDVDWEDVGDEVIKYFIIYL